MIVSLDGGGKIYSMLTHHAMKAHREMEAHLYSPAALPAGVKASDVHRIGDWMIPDRVWLWWRIPLSQSIMWLEYWPLFLLLSPNSVKWSVWEI